MTNKFLSALAACFPVVVIAGFMPIDLYGRNASGLEYDITLVHLFLGCGAILCGVIFALCLLFRIPRAVITMLWGLGAIVLLADVFAPTQLGKLDGTNTLSGEPLGYTLVELALALAVVGFLVVSRRRERNLPLFAGFSGLLVLGTAALYIGLPSAPAGDSDTSTAFSFRKDLTNIYEIHLDELQSDYALKAIKDLDLESEFTGFTFFENNISNYPYTEASIPSYLTGSIYTGGEFRNWMKGFDLGQIEDLKDLGYRIEIVGLPTQLQTDKADWFRSQEEIYKRVRLVKHPMIVDFIGLWLVKVLPNPLTNKALAWGRSIGSKASRKIEPYVSDDVPQSVDTGLSVFQSAVALKELTKKEALEGGGGRFLLIQALLPHAPYILDEGCKKSRVTGGSLESDYSAQTLCSVTLIADFLRELKSLGRYDDSIIVILSDHGSGWVGYQTDAPDAERPSHTGPSLFQGVSIFQGSIDRFAARSMATLMIKPAKADGPFEISDAKTQLIDVYPTIIDLIDQSPGVAVEGVSLKPCLSGDCGPLEERPQEFYVYSVDESRLPMYKNEMKFVNGHAYIVDTQETHFED